ncbi:MAG TPA: glycoside hydrolase family 15 protein [Candidatus Wujingus californicus]|uniref:glycoside hydrolase family 15 protein n=1 Tax=Candidatus Wujingus californicus TaxID=3367618 RepID=UPI001DBE9833|nr:hypothetical protein [Planctomycetota bacterium]MDO8131879.1 hypothetical protein [Candidatus Brocadiales bacterium]
MTLGAKNINDLNNALSVLEWVVDRELPYGVLAEQINPYTNEPLSVSPPTWSHAAFVTALLRYMKRCEEILVCDECGNSLFYMHRHT